jgi:hypothetical protein
VVSPHIPQHMRCVCWTHWMRLPILSTHCLTPGYGASRAQLLGRFRAAMEHYDVEKPRVALQSVMRAIRFSRDQRAPGPRPLSHSEVRPAWRITARRVLLSFFCRQGCLRSVAIARVSKRSQRSGPPLTACASLGHTTAESSHAVRRTAGAPPRPVPALPPPGGLTLSSVPSQ